MSILNNSAEISMFTFPTSSLHYVTILEFPSTDGEADSLQWHHGHHGPNHGPKLGVSESEVTEGSKTRIMNSDPTF